MIWFEVNIIMKSTYLENSGGVFWGMASVGHFLAIYLEIDSVISLKILVIALGITSATFF